MIVDDVYKDGKWLRTVGTTPRQTTKAGSYFAEFNRRCTKSLQIGKYARYEGCESYFKDFQDFADWAKSQVGYGWNLDKDLLVKGNKIYSKETCVFLPTELNNLLTKCNKARGAYPIGVNYDSKRGYKSVVSMGEGKVFLGYYESADQAFLVYKEAKESFIKAQAAKWRGKICERAYNALMNYQVEITD